jgi:aminotransferase
MKIANRMAQIPFSGIRQVFEEVNRREKAGEDIIHLEIGRPDFDTPSNIKKACQLALDQGKVHYSSNFGVIELRQAIAEKLKRDNDLSANPDTDIIVTVGANEAVFIAMMALLNPGDEVLVMDPCWFHYFYCARMAGAISISVPLRIENGFNPDIEELRSFITPKTRMMIINSPNNPTGAVYSKETFTQLAKLAIENDLWVISDEIYEKMIYDTEKHFSIATLPGMQERTITVNGFSKIYAMTGWRLGYAIAHKDTISALIRIHQYTSVCATTFAQWGAVEALTGPQTEADRMVQAFDRRRKLVYNALRQMPGIRVLNPKGTFYIFPDISGTGKTPDELAKFLLESAKIAVIPGTTLGNFGNNYIRISYANSYENLEIAMERMQKALQMIDT